MDIDAALEGLPPERQLQLLKRRLQRSEAARLQAEELLERRARELHRSNRDLQEREELLRERLELGNRQLLAAQRTARIATVYRSRGQNFIFSSEFGDLIGLPKGTITTLAHISAVLHPLDRRRAERSEYDFYSSCVPNADVSYDHRIVRLADKEVRWMRWTLRRETDGHGRLVSVFGTVQDITEQRLAQRRASALRKLADRRVVKLSKLTEELHAITRLEQQAVRFLRAVLDTVPQGIAVFDEDLKLAVWNTTMAGLTEIREKSLYEGLAFEDFANSHWRHDPRANADRIHRDSKGKVTKQAFAQKLSDGRTLQVDVIPRPAGGMVKIYTDVSPFKAIELDLRAKGIELTDRVDELLRVSSQLHKSNAAAEQANRYKSQFLAMMSHDIRTPMNGVLGLLETLARSPLDEKQKRQLELARASGQQLNMLLNDIIEIVRAESGKIQLQPEAVDLRQTIVGIYEFWRASNTNNQVSIACDVADDLPERAQLDPTRLRQLVDNLVSNAIKYTQRGEVRLATSKIGPMLRFEVSDTGPGIRKAQQEHLFDDFSRRQTMTSSRGESAGLGLAICKRLVSAMGGEIGVHSKVGKGSCFWIELPLILAVERAAPAAHNDDEAFPHINVAGAHILVAEDVPTNREVLSAMLDILECSYEMVENGKAAVAAARDRDFDLILMDMNMPEMDGIEATRAIRQLGSQQASVPIVAVTAHVLPEKQESLLAAGMNSVVIKPINLDMLAAKIAEALGERWAGWREADDAPEVPLLDEVAAGQLLAALPADRRARVLSMSITDIEHLSGELRSAIVNKDDQAARRAAHSLKGVAGNIGATRLASMVDNLNALDAGVFADVVADTARGIRHRFNLETAASADQ